MARRERGGYWAIANERATRPQFERRARVVVYATDLSVSPEPRSARYRGFLGIVERRLGEPLQSASDGGGWRTWPNDLRHPVIFNPSIRAISLSSVPWFPPERIGDMTSERLALVKTSVMGEGRRLLPFLVRRTLCVDVTSAGGGRFPARLLRASSRAIKDRSAVLRQKLQARQCGVIREME